MPEPSDTDWAYAAGFVDGEGCIAVVRSYEPNRGRYQYGVTVVVSNRDRGVLDWMQSTWGGSVQQDKAQGRWQQSWAWRCTTCAAKPFLNGIRPWLRIKSQQCDNALVMAALLYRSRHSLGPHPIPLEWLAEQERVYWIQRELNHRGNAAFVKAAMHSPRKINRSGSATIEAF